MWGLRAIIPHCSRDTRVPSRSARGSQMAPTARRGASVASAQAEQASHALGTDHSCHAGLARQLLDEDTADVRVDVQAPLALPVSKQAHELGARVGIFTGPEEPGLDDI